MPELVAGLTPGSSSERSVDFTSAFRDASRLLAQREATEVQKSACFVERTRQTTKYENRPVALNEFPSLLGGLDYNMQKRMSVDPQKPFFERKTNPPVYRRER